MEMYGKCSWYVLYTKPRHEKAVEEQLLKRKIEAFTPKITWRRRWSDRVKLVEEPLFKSYCFARFPLKDKVKIVSQPGVVDVVHFNKQYTTVDGSVISSLKIVAANELKIDPCPYLKNGDRVTVRRGPFKGLEGYIIEKRNKNATLVISIDAIAASVKCVIDADYVDLVYTD
jgi:transcription antitermination factor NusG